ncbi:Reverse transcriptase-like [Sesbania bispinosa]|nr:Reverse transcriptase-like [Sesbania bispinosa]
MQQQSGVAWHRDVGEGQGHGGHWGDPFLYFGWRCGTTTNRKRATKEGRLAVLTIGATPRARCCGSHGIRPRIRLPPPVAGSPGRFPYNSPLFLLRRRARRACRRRHRLKITSLQLEELATMEREMKDREQSETEMRKMREDLNRRIHDQKMASEIVTIPEDDWLQWGDNFEKPFGEGSSKKGEDEGAIVRVYFKGLVSEESVRGDKAVLAGIGVAICDLSDNLILEVSKPLIGNGTGKVATELKALIEAFNAAIALDLQRVIYFSDYYPLFQFVSPLSFSLFMAS